MTGIDIDPISQSHYGCGTCECGRTIQAIEPTAVLFNEVPIPSVTIYVKNRSDLDLVAEWLGITVKTVPVGKGFILHRAAGQGIAIHREVPADGD